MTMLADHPTWPVKKNPEPEPKEVDGFGGPPQVATVVHQCKPCPFCGGAMAVSNVAAWSPLGIAQVQVGCHNFINCVITPKIQCDPADMKRMIQVWNLRHP